MNAVSVSWICHRKSLQVSLSLLGNLTDFNSAVVLIVSILSLISCSPRLFFNSLETLPNVSTTIDITITPMTHISFQLSGNIQVFV